MIKSENALLIFEEATRIWARKEGAGGPSPHVLQKLLSSRPWTALGKGNLGPPQTPSFHKEPEVRKHI